VGPQLPSTQLKKGLAVGKDLQDMHGQLSQWAGAMSDLGQAEKQVKNPPWWKTLGGSVEEEAMAVFAAKRKAESMREELKGSTLALLWGHLLGTSWWLLKLKLENRKKEEEYRKAEMIQSIITWTIGSVLFLIASSIVVLLALYYIWCSTRKVVAWLETLQKNNRSFLMYYLRKREAT
jgi:hypothetical protein